MECERLGVPELPEVEIERRNLEKWLRDRQVVAAEAEKTRIFRGANRKQFGEIRGQLLGTRRRGKYLLLRFEKNRGFLAHLGMTGKFVHRLRGQTEPYSRARLLLDDGQVIHFRDPRMFGRIEPARADRLDGLQVIQNLGRDPLADGLTGPQLKEAIGSSKQAIKVALMDQHRVAGLGNIHAAEALFRARIHPARKPSSLQPAEWSRLAKSIHEAIEFALDREDGDEIEYVEEPGSENPFYVYGRGGEPCPRCGTPIESFVLGGRTTYFCPRDQPRRRPR